MALLFRTSTELEIKRELARLVGAQAEEVVEIGNRSILLPVSSNWALFPVNAPARVIREKADQFVASQATRS
jgi:kynureninase